ncbi:MAG: M48 family metalloprotease [Acidobacteriota bacterium]
MTSGADTWRAGRSSGGRRLVALLTACLLCVSCATTDLAPVSALGATYRPEPDELALWSESRAEEDQLLDEARIYDDPALERYLQDLVDELTSPGMAANPELRYEVTVLQDPTLNAFAYPHGSLFVHTGLLARMENEAQLATVLGHEMSHVELRHMLRYRRAAANREIAFTVVAVAALVALSWEARDAWLEGRDSESDGLALLGDLILHLGLPLAVVASVNGYGRRLEREADHAAFARLAAAGHDLQQAPRVYEVLQGDETAGDRDLEVFFFGSHPKLEERAATARDWVEERETTQSPRGDEPADDRLSQAERQERFVRHIRPLIVDNALLNLELGRLDLAEEHLLRAQALEADDPSLHLAFAQLFLERADAEPEQQAVHRAAAHAALREAVRLDPERPLPHRRLGLLLWQDDELEAACSELRLYLELDPRAPDAPTFHGYVQELEEQGAC